MLAEALGFIMFIGIVTALAGGMVLVFKILEGMNK